MADYLSYLKNNPDVAAWGKGAGLSDQQAALQHYSDWGMAEGRDFGGIGETANAYMTQNPDVAKWGYGTPEDATRDALSHYMDWGMDEGRAWGEPAPVAAGSLSPSFSAYMNRDPELARQTQADTSMSDMDYILQHWNTFGQGEGRVSLLFPSL